MGFTAVNGGDFIPQAAPFVMIDRLVYADETVSRARFSIEEDNLLVTGHFLSTAGLVEAMAQTAAAGSGYFHKQRGEAVPVGYIGAVQQLEVYDWPPVNEEIEIEISLQARVAQVSLISATVKMNERLIAKANLKIFVSNQQ